MAKKTTPPKVRVRAVANGVFVPGTPCEAELRESESPVKSESTESTVPMVERSAEHNLSPV